MPRHRERLGRIKSPLRHFTLAETVRDRAFKQGSATPHIKRRPIGIAHHLFTTRFGIGPIGCDGSARAETWIENALGFQHFERALIIIHMLGLQSYGLFPNETQPRQRFINARNMLWSTARSIDIFDA